MQISPQEIQDREFREAFRGYNQDDVDTFLDEIAVEFNRLYQENQRMKVQLAAIQQEVARLADSKDRTQMMPATPANGDAQIEASRKAAEAALDEAKRRATEVVQRAEHRAREIDDLTARRAKDVDSDASAALTDAQQRVGELRRQEIELRRRIRTFLEQQLAALEAVDLDATAKEVVTEPAPVPQAAIVGPAHSGSPVVERMAREFAAEKSSGPPSQEQSGTEPFWAAE
jgi:cell division initiation protein